MSYIALTGLVPFKGNDIEKLNKQILTCEVELDDPRIRLSYPMKEILKKMLVKDPSKRISV